MAKVFTVPPGLVAQVGKYGPASNDVPALVPDELAEEIAGDGRLRVERPAAPVEEPKKRARRAQEE